MAVVAGRSTRSLYALKTVPFPIAEDEIRKSETELGATLPTSYRESMKRLNGGTVEVNGDTWELFPIRDQSNRKVLSRTANHVLRETKAASEWPKFHENALAVASDGAGNLLVMFQEGPVVHPQVFIWNHEDGSLELAAEDFASVQRV